MLYSLAATRVIDSMAVCAPATELPAEAVVWASVVGCAVDAPNTLRKTAAVGWGNAGAVSSKAIQSGAGYVEWTVDTITATVQKVCGLSNGNSDANYTDIDFGIFSANANIYSMESGVQVLIGTIIVGDVLRVAVSAAGVITYQKNGAVLRTSLGTPTYPLLVDCALNRPVGALIVGAQISGILA